MAKIMRGLITLAAMLLASADDTATCALNGAEAVDELLDSAVFIWASVERCGQPGEVVRCEVNIASAIESVTGMINVIMKAVHKCGGLEDAKCGMAAGVLTKSLAGVAAASGGIAAKCGEHPQETVRGVFQHIDKFHDNKFGHCIVDVKGSMKSMFKAIKRIMTVTHNCDDENSKHCVHNSLKIVAALASLGEYLTGAIGHCGAGESATEFCASQILKEINELNNLAKAGVALARDCHAESDSRLYLLDDEEEGKKKEKDSSSMTLGLAALLPVTAVLSFVGGSRLAKARSVRESDCESLMEVEE